jgi:hypothetical protein
MMPDLDCSSLAAYGSVIKSVSRPLDTLFILQLSPNLPIKTQDFTSGCATTLRLYHFYQTMRSARQEACMWLSLRHARQSSLRAHSAVVLVQEAQGHQEGARGHCCLREEQSLALCHIAKCCCNPEGPAPQNRWQNCFLWEGMSHAWISACMHLQVTTRCALLPPIFPSSNYCSFLVLPLWSLSLSRADLPRQHPLHGTPPIDIDGARTQATTAMATIQLQTSKPWQKPGRHKHTSPHTKTLTPAIPQEPHNHVHHLRPTVSHASTPASTATPTTYTAPTCLSAASYMHRHPTSTTKKTQTRSTLPPDPPLCMGVRQPAPTHLPDFACLVPGYKN